jgi:formate/nitrite transporter FocA (FNT family)
MADITINALTPIEAVFAIADAGASKGATRADKVFFSAISAGCLLAFACGTVLTTGTAPAWQESAPGLLRTIRALVFPYGLCMILLTGADLCTCSFMVRQPLFQFPIRTPYD